MYILFYHFVFFELCFFFFFLLYINLIKTLSKYSYIQVDKINKIKLNKGKKFFELSKSIIEKEKPLYPFILKNNLTFPFPEDLENDLIEINENQNFDFIKENYLTNALNDFKIKIIEKNLELLNFHYDVMNSNVELSVLLQIIDDTGSFFHRRNNILHKTAKYIGINIKKLLFCYHLTFAKDSIKN